MIHNCVILQCDKCGEQSKPISDAFLLQSSHSSSNSPINGSFGWVQNVTNKNCFKGLVCPKCFALIQEEI